MRGMLALWLVAGLAAGTGHAAIRAMAKDDPNLDPAWDWRPDLPQPLYSSVNGGAVERHWARLPHHTPGSVLNGLQALDFEPEDGWVLVHRDFGTQAEAQPFPFFTLYNQYRGLFRVMLFNAAHREGSYFLGELSFLDGERYASGRAALFTFADPDPGLSRMYLNQYDPKLTLTAFSNMTAYGSWAVFDFPLVGFDPGLPGKDPILVFKLTSIEKQALSLKTAGDLQLFQLVEGGEARPDGASPAGRVLAAAHHGATTYKTVDAFIQNELFSEAGSTRHQREPWYRAARAIAQSALGSYLPLVGAMAGVIESFIGGATQAAEWEPLKFTGQFQFNTEGAVLTRRDLWFHNLFLNAGPAGDTRAQRPLRPVPWGIYNFPAACSLRLTPAPGRLGGWGGGGNARLVQPPEIQVNPGSGMDLTAIRVAFLEPGGKPGGTEGGLTSSGFMDLKDALDPGCQVGKGRQGERIAALLWELTFRIRNPTRHSDANIIILKRTGFIVEP